MIVKDVFNLWKSPPFYVMLRLLPDVIDFKVFEDFLLRSQAIVKDLPLMQAAQKAKAHCVQIRLNLLSLSHITSMFLLKI